MPSSPLDTHTQVNAKLGRAAGFGYLAMAVTGAFWFGAMQTFRAGGDAALLAHLRDSRLLFQLSIVSGAAQFVAYLVTAVLLYRRFGPKAPVAAGLLLVFVVASVPLSLVAVARQMELLPLLNGAGLDAPSQVALILRDFDTLVQLSSLFWGLWLFPLAWFAFRAGGWSRLVGVVVTLGGLGYLVAFFRPVLLAGVAVPTPVQGALLAFGVATVFSEFVAILWLLIASDRAPKVSA